MPKLHQNSLAGFTLLEVLLAFVILGIAAAALFSIFGDGVTKVSRAENERTAVLTAQSVLALVGSEIPLEINKHQGDLHGTRWSINIEPYDKSPTAPFPDKAVPSLVTTPYLVTVHTETGLSATQVAADLVSLRLKLNAP